MSIQVNFQGSKFDASSKNYGRGSSNPFCTFDITSEGNNVTVYIKSVDDAYRLVEAAAAAYRNAQAIEREQDLKDMPKLVALLSEPTVFDSV